MTTSSEALLRGAQDSDSTQVARLIADDHAQQLTADALSTLSEMQSEEDRLLQLRQLSEDRSRLGVKVTVWATGGLGVLLIVLVFYFTRRDEAILRRTERELATTLHSIGDAVISTDTDGSIRFMNPEAERLTGWPQASGRGKPLAEVFRIIGGPANHPVTLPISVDGSRAYSRSRAPTGPQKLSLAGAPDVQVLGRKIRRNAYLLRDGNSENPLAPQDVRVRIRATRNERNKSPAVGITVSLR